MKNIFSVIVVSLLISACSAARLNSDPLAQPQSSIAYSNHYSIQGLLPMSPEDANRVSAHFLEKSSVSEKKVSRHEYSYLKYRFPDLCEKLDFDGEVFLVHAKGNIEWPFDEKVKGNNMAIVVDAKTGTILRVKMSRRPLIDSL